MKLAEEDELFALSTCRCRPRLYAGVRVEEEQGDIARCIEETLKELWSLRFIVRNGLAEEPTTRDRSAHLHFCDTSHITVIDHFSQVVENLRVKVS